MDDENLESLSAKLSAAQMRRDYVRTIADKICTLVRDEKIAPGDIMVLVQRRHPFAPLLVDELKSRDIDVAGSDRIILPDYPAIRDLLNLVRFCINQTDEYSLCCVLKSPFYRLTEDDIYKLCRARTDTKNSVEPITVFDILKQVHPDIFAELNDIIKLAETLAPYSFFMRVLNAYNYRKKTIAALGAQVIDPLEEFMTICLAYERIQPGTLRHFLKWFITGGSEIKRDMDAGSGVRIVTVHGSKGLEAPIVFLIDTVRTPRDKPEKIFPINTNPDDNPNNFSVWMWTPQKKNSENLMRAADAAMDEKLAEYYRLLYVAMTRARDRLYIYGFTPNKNPPDIAWHTKLMEIMPGMPGAESDDEIIRISDDK